MVVPLTTGALGGSIRQIMVELGKKFEKNNILKETIREMQKKVLMDSETTEIIEKGSLGTCSRDG